MATVTATLTAETTTVYHCLVCDGYDEGYDDDPLYECQVCGKVFNQTNSATGYNNQCPQCTKLAKKLADRSCAGCGEGPIETLEMVECPLCHEIMEANEFTEHIEGGNCGQE